MFKGFFSGSTMKSNEILESGLLELYALGSLEVPEVRIVEDALSGDPLLVQELWRIEDTLLSFAQANAIEPNPTIKALLIAKIEYIERLKNGEVPSRLPTLNPNSKVEEFERWLARTEMQREPDFDAAHVMIISDEPEKMTALVRLRYGAPPETHTLEHEKFLIVEGTCDLTVGSTVHALMPGDYFPIPLHVSHNVVVTSKVPCKIILQRVKVH